MSVIEFPTESERFRVRAMCAEGLAQPVRTISHTATLGDAAHALMTQRLDALPIVDDRGRLIKIVTEVSIADASLVRLWTASALSTNPGTGALLSTSVLDFAVPAVSVRPESAKTMLRSRIRAVPMVVDDRPIGIVTWAAVFAAGYLDEPELASISYLSERGR